MIFTASKKYSTPSEPPLHYVQSPAMTFSSKYRNFLLQKMQTTQTQNSMVPIQQNIHSPPQPKQIIAKKEPVDPKKKPMKWGEPTWFLFHTLAEKIKPEYYSEIQKELLNIIYIICTNLPCPTCAKHATEYLNAINFNTINTKESLKILLYNFHNEVNRRKGFPEFPYQELSAKYSAANTVNIIHNFMPYFEDKVGGFKLIADNLHRSRVALQLKAWFNKNISMFEL